MDHHQGVSLPAHILIFPLPVQGHVNSMLKLAELLCLADVQVTFAVTDHIHDRLLRYTNVHDRFSCYPGFRFETISAGDPAEGSQSGESFIIDLINYLRTKVKPLFRDLLMGSNCLRSDLQRPLTCIIADGILSFSLEVAEELGIPIIYFRTVSACSFWSYFSIPQLIEAGELPFKGNDLDVPIQSVSGMEAFLRRRDLPSIFRAGELNDPGFEFLWTETMQTPRAKALILNTFEDLEGPILSHIRAKLPDIYTIGPLHVHLKARLAEKRTSTAAALSNSLYAEDRSCITWLDLQPPKSVIYVSFGSIATLTRDQLMELWHGLVGSRKRFLWVMRMDMVTGGESQIPAELSAATEERGYIVKWAPQEEVLAHPAVGGFLTHSGWNSTLESILAGVPMICWPHSVDQQINSRFVGEVWKLGLDMKDTCDRITVEKMIKDLMEVRKDESKQSADRMAELARKAISDGGSSCCNLDRLIEDIKLMVVQSPHI